MLNNLTIVKAIADLKNKKISAYELTKFFLQKIKEKNPVLNAFITITEDLALEQAKESDIRYANNQAKLLDGIPIAVKDLFCTKGVLTTAGSKMLANFVPEYESTVTQNLLDVGVITLGKANMDEFAMGSANLNSAFGPCINPYRSNKNPDKKLVPGGSSGGSVVAVAGGMALAATASDTGGSIRQPAAFCGLVGIKPTYGLCSRYGMVAFASSLDQAGPVAKTVGDCALMLQAMASYDPKDATSANVKIPNYQAMINRNIKGLRVGIADEYMAGLSGEIAAAMQQGIEWLKKAGCEIVNISLKTTPYALPTYYIIAPAEASSNLARYDGVRYGVRQEGSNIEELYKNTRGKNFGWEVKRRIFIGTYVLSTGYYDAYYTKAQQVRRLISNDFNEAFKNVDLILTPTTTGPAFGLNDNLQDPVAMYLNDVFTVTANLAGLPGMSIPIGLNDDGLPLGLQLIGPKFSEQNLFNVGQVLEDNANFLSQPLPTL